MNAFLSILSMSSGSETEARLEQSSKADLPIFLTLSGMSTAVMSVRPSNALSPIAVTA